MRHLLASFCARVPFWTGDIFLALQELVYHMLLMPRGT